MSQDESADGGVWVEGAQRLPARLITGPPIQLPNTAGYSTQPSASSTHSSTVPSSAGSSEPSLHSKASLDLKEGINEVKPRFMDIFVAPEIFDPDKLKNDLCGIASSVQDFADRVLEPEKTLTENGASLPEFEPQTNHVEKSASIASFSGDVSNDDSSFLEPEGEPLLFGEVIPGVYRSSYPRREHHDYLKGLGLKTILSLVAKDPPDGFHSFIEENSINHITIDMPGTKKVPIPLGKMTLIMETVFEKENYPLLIHCKQGKHRTGCVVAILQIVRGVDIEEVLQDYRDYAGLKVRDEDIEYIRNFEIQSLPTSVTSSREIGVETEATNENIATIQKVP